MLTSSEAEAPHASPVRSAAGHPFQVRGDAAVIEAADRAFATLPPWSGPVDVPVVDYLVVQSAHGFTLSFAGTHLVRPDLGAVLDQLEWYVNQQVIDAIPAHTTGIHASAASRAGQLVLLPAMSGSGKSTTVAGLVRAGWDYLTDEVALLDQRTLTVSAYAKPIALDAGSWPLFPEVTAGPRSDETCLVPATDLGGVVAEPGPVTLVVSPQYREGAVTELEPLSPAALAMLLARSTFEFSTSGATHLRAVSAVARTATGYRLTIGDLDEAVAAIDALASGLTR